MATHYFTKKDTERIISMVLSGSCCPCHDLLKYVEMKRISMRSANAAVQKHYGGRVRNASEGAQIEYNHMRALDI